MGFSVTTTFRRLRALATARLMPSTTAVKKTRNYAANLFKKWIQERRPTVQVPDHQGRSRPRREHSMYYSMFSFARCEITTAVGIMFEGGAYREIGHTKGQNRSFEGRLKGNGFNDKKFCWAQEIGASERRVTSYGFNHTKSGWTQQTRCGVSIFR